jgi:hypothetical protein
MVEMEETSATLVNNGRELAISESESASARSGREGKTKRSRRGKRKLPNGDAKVAKKRGRNELEEEVNQSLQKRTRIQGNGTLTRSTSTSLIPNGMTLI